ncbi:MAG: 2-C-methyl-D-erythritol 4-phosphate cytidylyltransferase [Actinomycetaceae bacterium]|nr:2-C-methyl-D-erythritol 4-phosphate cytidylyltransferase [Actinomycetaceae bacterium]
MTKKDIFAVVTAAGSGTRLGYAQPKALVPLVGVTLVERAVETFLKHPRVAGIVVTAPAESPVFERFEKLFEGVAEILVVPGGATRQASVYQGLLGLSVLAERLGLVHRISETSVLIHDAARCLMPAEVIDRVALALESSRAVIPVLPVVDTLTTSVYQEFECAGESVDRSKLRAVQTPQGFKYPTILLAHQKAASIQAEQFTDDASLMELVGESVQLVEGSELSLKITTPFDLRVANCLLGFGGALEQTNESDASPPMPASSQQ